MEMLSEPEAVQSDGDTPINSEDIDGTAINGNRTEEPNQIANQEKNDSSEENTQWTTVKQVFNVPPALKGRVAINFAPTIQRARSFSETNQVNPSVSQNGNAPAATPAVAAQMELWVETKTADGKSYFYHALTRETTWNKPEGANVKIMTQSEVEEMNKKQLQLQQQQQQQQTQKDPNAFSEKQQGLQKNNSMESKPETKLKQPPPNVLSKPPPNQQSALSQPPPNLAGMGGPPPLGQPPPMHQQPPPFFGPPGMHPPPNFGQPPFGMPPPGFGGGFPGGAAPWGMPWNHPMHAQEKPATKLIIKPGVIDPAVIARAAEWSEHRAPDGRPYYYHAARGESVWEKPQALRDMEAARMAAHSGATPQQAMAPSAAIPTMPPPHMMPNAVMHMPPASAPPGFDPALAYAAAAAAAAASAKTNEANKAALQNIANEKAKKAAEEKRKKEEEAQKKAAAAAAKPQDKSRPICSIPIAGTPWCVVWTGDARVFFYNPSTRSSIWERPEELLDRSDVDKAVTNPPDQLKKEVQQAKETISVTSVQIIEANKSPVTEDVEENDEEDDGIIKIRDESDTDAEEVPKKRPKVVTKTKRDPNEAAAEAEQRAAKERALVPLETRVKQFKEMLREKDVSAFSTWEKELHKIVFDPRYLLLTCKERKQVFEKYVKDRAEEERKEKRNKMRQKRDDFRKLMEDAKLHGKSSFSEFCQRYGKDDRYKAIEKIRERESLFNEYIVDVRRREKEEKILKVEQIRKDFIEMLRERSDLDRHTRWHDIKKKFEMDSRYRAVDSSYLREEYFQDFLHIMKDEKRRQKERDREREKEKEREREKDRDKEKEKDREKRAEKKSDRKDRDRDRSRSRSRDHKEKKDKDKDKEREKDKNKEKDKDKDKEKEKEKDKKKQEESEEGEHHDDEEEYRNSDAEDEAEKLRKQRDRQMRAEQSIREREKEVQRALAGHLRDRDKEREHHKRDEAIGHFNALLVDLVRNPDLTWKEAKRQLRKDHRWDIIDSLDREDRERIFNEHIDNLMKKKREKFREMLDELSSLQLTSSWKDIKKLIKEDPRYLKYNSSEKCEREFRDYIKDKTLNAKTALRELLQECKLITFKSHDLVKENPNHLKDIQDILKNDKRYLVLEHMPDDRAEIVVSYLEELHKKGPPPPPTASESSRRK